jgi:O-acetyl-ADP-ribose deacetylase (regulator of RNase III)
MATLSAIQADITTLKVDAIVNAANSFLLGGGGVDGAIHRAAGPELLAECRGLGGCRAGQAKITHGYRLPARHVIHAVGPVWHGGAQQEREKLASCYHSALKLAVEYRCATIAFPGISTGAYGFPVQEAAEIAVRTVRDCTQMEPALQEVIFCCFSKGDLQIYQELLLGSTSAAAIVS